MALHSTKTHLSKCTKLLQFIRRSPKTVTGTLYGKKRAPVIVTCILPKKRPAPNFVKAVPGTLRYTHNFVKAAQQPKNILPVSVTGNRQAIWSTHNSVTGIPPPQGHSTDFAQSFSSQNT